MQSGDERPAEGGQAADVGSLAVCDAVDRELADLAARDPKLAWSPLALSARKVAERMDDPRTSSTSVSMLARSLLDTLDRLRELAPIERKRDQVDELATARAKRRSGT